MTDWVTTRTVIEEQSVSDTTDAFSKDYPRFESLWIGIAWLLARKGHELGAHRAIGDIQYRLYVVASVADDLPEVTLLYTVTPETITIHDIGIQIGKDAQKIPDAPKQRNQREAFIETARALGCDESEAVFNDKLKKLVKPKTNKKDKK